MKYAKSIRLRFSILFKDYSVYDPEELIEGEEKYLLEKGYKLQNFVYIGETKQRLFLIREMPVEGPIHTFLVWNITRILTEYPSIKIKTYQTKRPDIIFKINKKKYAIEVETGIGYKKHKKRLEQKKEQNYEKYGTNWFILCATSRMTKQYKKYGKAISRKQFKKYLNTLLAKEDKILAFEKE